MRNITFPSLGDPSVRSRHTVRITFGTACNGFDSLIGQSAELVILRNVPYNNVFFRSANGAFLWSYDGGPAGNHLQARTGIDCFICCCDHSINATLGTNSARGSITHVTNEFCRGQLRFE